MDVNMPRMNGLEATREIVKMIPDPLQRYAHCAKVRLAYCATDQLNDSLADHGLCALPPTQ